MVFSAIYVYSGGGELTKFGNDDHNDLSALF